ncbi:MAG: GAF and ANTAR domain-containing protein [Actinomycetota bacterium]|nr:GAF and ANTAR domain-containing protein [Actinomycetota bacterium]
MTEEVGDLSETFASIARELMAEDDVHQTLERTVQLAVETIDGCDFAGVSLFRGREIESPAQTDEMVTLADRMQVDLGEGPCLSAMREEQTVQVDDLSADARWPRWAPRVAAELGVRSMLAFQLYNSKDSLGALNLYSKQVDAFDADARGVGLVFASHAAVALTGAQIEENLKRAVQTRNLIGQAQGILMERFGLSADKAFELLRRVSQNQNVKLRDVAARLAVTRQSPGLPDDPKDASDPRRRTAG